VDRHVPHAIESARIDEALLFVARHFPPTPLIEAPSLQTHDRRVYLKLETRLPTGSFKVRGALFSLSRRLSTTPVKEVVAASTGNHGAAVAFAGRELGVPAVIFLPTNPNPVKAGRIRELGARLVETGPDLNAAIDAARDFADSHSAFFLHDATDPDIPVGTATIGHEILSERSEIDAIYVPVGDTALIRGVASGARRLRPAVRIVGVVAERAPAYYLSWRDRRVVETDSADTIADGLAVRRPLAPNVAAIGELVDDMRLVSEDEMRSAMALLERNEGVVAEPAAAAPLAALLKEDPQTAGTIALLVTGSNVAPGTV
jgi:threonine dehydratase